MYETILAWAEAPATPWWVLCGVATIVTAEAARVSRRALWGDLFGDEADDD